MKTFIGIIAAFLLLHNGGATPVQTRSAFGDQVKDFYQNKFFKLFADQQKTVDRLVANIDKLPTNLQDATTAVSNLFTVLQTIGSKIAQDLTNQDAQQLESDVNTLVDAILSAAKAALDLSPSYAPMVNPVISETTTWKNNFLAALPTDGFGQKTLDLINRLGYAANRNILEIVTMVSGKVSDGQYL